MAVQLHHIQKASWSKVFLMQIDDSYIPECYGPCSEKLTGWCEKHG